MSQNDGPAEGDSTSASGARQLAELHYKAGLPGRPVAAYRRQWYLVECHDGELPVLRGYPTPEALARRIGALEGINVAVWPFYGAPIVVSEGPSRKMRLPDGRTYWCDNEANRAPAHPITARSDGFLGDPIFRPDYETEEPMDPADDAQAASPGPVQEEAPPQIEDLADRPDGTEEPDDSSETPEDDASSA